MPDVPPPTLCPVCGAAIDAAATEGGCAVCLLGDAMSDPGKSGALGSIGVYELVEIIARGGMGIVYRARQIEPEREVALKALPGAELLSAEARQRFKIEAEAMARLEHPAILPIYELGEEDGTPFFTMKLARGGSLAARLETYRGKWREIAELIAKIAEAAHYAHERGVLHRDLKPGNILFDENGQIQVSDFGLAKIVGSESDLTRTIALMGTPNYMAPELTRGGKGAATTACDVWSLGVMLYELLAGHPPFHGDNLATVLRQLNEEEPALLPREVPRDLVVITRKALQKTPAQRYASAGALVADLRRWLRGEAIEARPVPLIEQAMLWAARRPALAGMAAALLVVLAVSAALLWRSNARLKDALATADSHLTSSLNSEARALMQSQDLKARTRVQEVVRELSQSGGDAVAQRSLAVRGLLMTGLTPADPLEVRYANRASKVGFSSDFTRYATGGVKSGCRVLDVAGKAPPLVLRDPAGQQGSSFLFSADGRWLVVKTRERMTRVYDLQNPQVPPFVPKGEKRDVSWPVAAFPPGGGHFLYAKGDDKVWLHRMDAAADAEDEVFFTAPRGVVGLCYSPDGRRLAVQWYEGWGVLDVETRQKLWQRDEKISAVSPLWAPNGSLVGVGLTHPSRILLVEPETGLFRHVFMGHRGTVSQAVFTPDGTMLLSIGWDAQLMLWDVATDMVVGRHALAPRGLGISPDGRRIAFAPDWDSLQVHDLDRPVIWRSWEMPALGASQIYHIDLSADGAQLLNTTPGATFLWDAEKGVFRGALMHEKHNSILTGYFDTPHRLRVLRSGANGREFRLKSPDEKNGLALAYEEVPSAAFPLARTADHRHLIVRDASGEYQAIEEGGKVAARLPEMTRAEPVELSPDQTMAAYVSGGLLRVVRVADGTVLATEQGKSSWAMRFLADGSHLVGCTKETMQVWETRTWQVVARWPAWLSDGFPSFACARDSSLLALMVGDGVVELRETKTWQPLLRLTAPGLPADHSGRTHLVWSVDSRRLMVAATGPKVYEWDITALREELGKLGLDW